jgi:hypothetical protein
MTRMEVIIGTRRQLGKEKVRFTPSDRAFLAALLHRLPPEVVASASAVGTSGYGPTLAP